MKYKTLCRLLVRLMGVYFLGHAIPSLINLGFLLLAEMRETPNRVLARSGLYNYGYPVGFLVSGLVLLFAARSITDLLIPSNRPYCHECGYDLTGAVGNVCAECGTTFKPVAPGVEPRQ